MKIYHANQGIIIEYESRYYLHKADWQLFVNDDNLRAKTLQLLPQLPEVGPEALQQLLPPMGQHQELWACGVTYLNSKLGRQEESHAAGGGDFYERVYFAPRPEVFFKSTAHRVRGSGQHVSIRKDSSWDVPEPELTLVVTSSGKIVGYTIGNDMSSRSIEGENPLYLPQAKTYDGCAALGPCVYVPEGSLPENTAIRLFIYRNNLPVFEGQTSLGQMKRSLEELVSWVFAACSFPHGCLILTGTGIVPGSDFTLQSEDRIDIHIDGIGLLTNTVA